MPGLYELSLDGVRELLDGEPAYRAGQVWEGLYKRGERPSEMTTLPAALRGKLEDLPDALQQVTSRTSDGGDTAKWLFELHDGPRIETVLMKYQRRATVCVSTQAGCAMACSFCATGQAGFSRHLSVGEIVEQVAIARREAMPARLSNVVFMGMGEPLANYDRVWGSVERLNSDMGISARHLTISTVGLVPGIRRLSKERLQVGLAVSLHAANDALRDSLVPMNRTYPLDVLVEACQSYVTTTQRRLSFEWALIDGVNDRSRDAFELSEIARGLGAHVNLIPLNPTPGYAVRGSSPRRVREFRQTLETLGVNATVRSTRGAEIDAACGQLSGSHGEGASVVRLSRRGPRQSIERSVAELAPEAMPAPDAMPALEATSAPEATS
jgi:23S rRNA (adenine2503-C2)-methyltransferase